MDLLGKVLAVVGALRVAELLYAQWTARKLAASGATPVRPDGMAAIVAVHVLWFAGMLVEDHVSGIRAGSWTFYAIVFFLTGTTLRYWSMAVLGWRWSTRVWVLPQAPLVRRGPYTLFPHPIYVGVMLELAALPLAFGLWWTALGITVLHALALRHRIAVEEQALGLRKASG